MVKRGKARGKGDSVLDIGLWERVFPVKTKFHVSHIAISVTVKVETNHNY